MSRKSLEAKSVSAVIELTRKLPEPPEILTEEQADTWRLVINSCAGDMISPESYPILVEYCRSISAANAIAKQLDSFDPGWIDEADGLLRWDKFLSIQNRVSARMVSLATKLRITPQVRIHKEKAGLAAAKSGKPRPWQFESE